MQFIRKRLKSNSLQGLAWYIWDSPTLTTWGNFFISSAKNIIILPILLYLFSGEQIAVWMLFMTIIILSNLIEPQFFGTFSRLISYAFGGAKTLENYTSVTKREFSKGPNVPLLEDIYGTMGIMFILPGILTLLILGTFGTLSVAKVIAYNTNQSDLWLAWVIIVITASLVNLGRKYGSVLHGMNYISMVNRWNMVFIIINIIISVLVIFLWKSVLGLVIVNRAIAVATIIRDRFLMRRAFRSDEIKPKKSFQYNRDIAMIAWAPAWRSTVTVLFSTGVTEVTGVVYAQIASPANLATYLLALRIISILSNVSRAPFYSKLPRFAQLRARSNYTGLANLARSAITFSLSIFALGVVSVTVLAEPILVLLKSSLDFVPLTLWSIMGLVWFLERHHAMHAHIYATTNHIPFYIPTGISGAINIGLILGLIKYIDVWAFPIAQGISNLLINNWWNVKISLRSLGQPAFSYMKTSFLLPLIAFIAIQVLLLLINGYY